MMVRTLVCAFFLFAASTLCAEGEKPAEAAAAPEIILDTISFWHCHFTMRDEAFGTPDDAAPNPPDRRSGHRFNTDLPPGDWMQPDFDDSVWGRRPGPFFSGYGYHQQTTLGLLCLRGTFAVADPGKVTELKFSTAYRGGMVVYMNGQEIFRGHLPEDSDFETFAEGYPDKAYLRPDGAAIKWGWGDPGKYRDRCELRIRRKNDVVIPASTLRKGTNILAIELHRSPTSNAWVTSKNRWPGRWNHIGLLHARLTANAGSGITPNLVRPKGLQVWNADPVTPVFDADYGDPNVPLRPISIVGSQNGRFSGQVVIGRDTPLKGLKAAVTDLKLEGGDGVIKAENAVIRWPVNGGTAGGAGSRYPGVGGVTMFDRLTMEPPAEVPVWVKNVDTRWYKGPIPVFGAVQPVWVTVYVPKDAKSGTYEGTFTISMDEIDPIEVPVRLEVCGWKMPDRPEFVMHTDFVESAESVALRYEVPYWSDKHFELIGKSFELMGRAANKTVYMHLINKSNHGNSETMVRWIKDGDGYTYDYSILERYLDLYIEKAGKPQFAIFYVSDRYTGAGYFGRASKSKAGPLVSLLDPSTKKVTELEGPPYDNEEEAKAFWKPVADGIREILKKRELSDRWCIGLASDSKPSKPTVMVWKVVAPEARWVHQGHGLDGQYYGVPLGYNTTVWKPQWAADPSVRRTYGWKNPSRIAHFHRDIHKLDAITQLLESRLTGERNIAGNQAGFGRMSADFWPVLKDKSGRMVGSISSRYPQSNWAQCNIRMSPYLEPGKDGALSTARFEMVCEGVQECEARISIEKVLTDKQQRFSLGEDEAHRLQAILDKRTRGIICSGGFIGSQWFAGSGWQERSRNLFSAAAECQGAQATLAALYKIDMMRAEGKTEEAAKACRAFMKENETDQYAQGAALKLLVKTVGEGAMKDLLAAMGKPGERTRTAARKLGIELKGDGMTDKWIGHLKQAKPPARPEILGVLAGLGDKAALPVVKKEMTHKDESVRTAAIKAVAGLGGKEEIPELVKVLAEGTPAERAAVETELVGMKADGAGAAVAAAVSEAKPAAKAALLGVLAKREEKEQLPAVMTAASDENETVRVAALRAMGRLADEKALPGLVGLLGAAKTEGEVKVAERSVRSVCDRVENKESCVGPLAAGIDGSTAAGHCALLRLLGRTGGAKALETVKASAKSDKEEVQDTAVEVLADWVAIDALDPLLEIATTAAKEEQKLRAHQGYVRLLDLPSERKPEESLKMVKAGLDAARRPDEKNLLLVVLSKIKTLEAMKLAEACCEDEATSVQAGSTLVGIAAGVPAKDKKEAKEALRKLIGSAKDKGVKSSAQKTLAAIEKYEDYIVDWEVSGPYTEEGKDGTALFDVVFDPEKPDAKDVKWKKAEPITDGWLVDLTKVVGGENRVAYLRTTVESPEEREVLLELGSDDGVKVWLNGEQIHALNKGRGVVPGEDKVKTKLKAGKNLLLLKVNQGGGGWGACARFRKPDGSQLD